MKILRIWEKKKKPEIQNNNLQKLINRFLLVFKLAICMGNNANLLHDILRTHYLLDPLESILGAQRWLIWLYKICNHSRWGLWSEAHGNVSITMPWAWHSTSPVIFCLIKYSLLFFYPVTNFCWKFSPMLDSLTLSLIPSKSAHDFLFPDC